MPGKGGYVGMNAIVEREIALLRKGYKGVEPKKSSFLFLCRHADRTSPFSDNAG